MKTYVVRRCWQMCDEVAVPAESADDAYRIAEEWPLSTAPFCPPESIIEMAEYVPDSLMIDPDCDIQPLS